MARQSGVTNQLATDFRNLQSELKEVKANFGEFILQVMEPFNKQLAKAAELANQLHGGGIGFFRILSLLSAGGAALGALQMDELGEALAKGEEARRNKPKGMDEEAANRAAQQLKRLRDMEPQLNMEAVNASERADLAKTPTGWAKEIQAVIVAYDEARRAARRLFEERRFQIDDLGKAETEHANVLREQNQIALDERLRQIGEEQAARLRQINEEIAAEKRKQEVIKSSSEIAEEVWNLAAKEISRGMAQATVDLISGAKSAGEAFREFFASFMRMIAEAILQALIFRAIQGFAGYFKLPIPGAASGGLFLRPMAEGGVQGVHRLDSPTIIPRFGVLAGEAGSEVAAFIASPRMSTIAGAPAITGLAQGHHVAMLNLDRAASGGGAGSPGGWIPGGPGGLNVNLNVTANVDPRVNIQFQTDAARLAVTEVDRRLASDSTTAAAVRRIAG